MIYIILVSTTIVLVIICLKKFLSFKKPWSYPNDKDKLAVRSIPLTLAILSGILYYFWSHNINPLHLLYIYPVIFYFGQLLISYILASFIIKERADYAENLLQVLEKRLAKEELKDSFRGHRFVIPRNFSSEEKTVQEFDEIVQGSLLAAEKGIVDLGVEEIMKKPLDMIFNTQITSVCLSGKFSGHPNYITAYYKGEKPVALGARFFMDAESDRWQGPLGQIVSSFSKKLGECERQDKRIYWHKSNISAYIASSEGPSMSLFIIDNSV